MSGYTPVFDSIYSGSLHGQWPAAALMATLLPLCDKNGHIDLHPRAISAMTGWPMKLLEKGLEQLMAPDPDSRSSEENGRRLVLLDPESRSWGWSMVNFVSYREKARLTAKNAREITDGRNAERMAHRRNTERPPETAGDRRSPPVTDPSNANANANTEDKENPLGFAEVRSVYPKRHGSQRWADAEAGYNARRREGYDHATIMAGVKRYAVAMAADGKAGTRFVQQAGTFFGTNRGFLDSWGPDVSERPDAPAMLPDGSQNPVVAVNGKALRKFLVDPNGRVVQNLEAIQWQT